MSGSGLPRLAVVILCLGLGGLGRAAAPPGTDLSGTWQLNPGLSDFPRVVGFDPDWQTADSTAGGRTGSGRGGRSGRSGNSGGSIRLPSQTPRFESEADSKKIRELAMAATEPPAVLTIVATDATVTIRAGGAQAQLFHTAGKEETMRLEAGPIGVTAKWDHTQLVIRYLIEKDREVRYRYWRDPSTDRLIVQTQFADEGHGEVIQRVYDAAAANDEAPR